MSKIHDDNDLTVSAFNRDDNEPTVTAVRKDATVIMNTAELEEKLRRARQEALNEAGIKRDYVLSPDGELDFDALLRDEEGFESEPQEDGDDDYDEEEASEASPAAKRIIARRAEEKRRKKRTVTIVCIAAAIVALLVVGTLIIRSTAQNKAYNDSFELAQSYYYDGKYDEALSELRQALSVKKTDECLLLMSECYEAKSDYVNAIAILESSNSGSSVISKRLEQLRKAKEAYDEGKTVIICGEPFDADTEILDLSGKGIKSSRLSELSRLEKLKTLNLSDNEIIGLSFLKGLNELTTLDLRSNKIKDISVLSGLTELRTLYLDNNRIEDFSPLYSLHNLGILYITGMDISETQLAELKTALPSCIIYSDDASPDVVEITLGGRTFKSDVTSLDLSGCGISDISLLSLCTSLEKLDLGDNSIKDLTPLMDITGLKSLDLENNKIDDVRIEDTTYPNLQYRRLANGEYLPTLIQYLQEGARYPQMKIVLEIKSHRDAAREQQVTDDIVKLVHDLGLQRQVEYIAFSRVVCARVHEVDPQAKIAYLNGDLSPQEVKNLGWTGIDYEKGVFQRNPSWSREAKELGLEVNVWTLRGEDDIKAHQTDPNIDLFTTDDPDVALRLTQPVEETPKDKKSKKKSK